MKCLPENLKYLLLDLSYNYLGGNSESVKHLGEGLK